MLLKRVFLVDLRDKPVTNEYNHTRQTGYRLDRNRSNGKFNAVTFH